MKVVTADQMRAIEAEVVRRGTSLDELMNRAAAAVARAAAAAGGPGPVLVLVGPGNNGGDGLLAARALRASNRTVTAYTYRRQDLLGYDGDLVRGEDDPEQQQLRGLLERASVLVDALLGIGQNRAPEDLLDAIVRVCNEGRPGQERIAVDIPTGVETDTGTVWDEAFRATTTICMGFLKRGVVLHPGATYAGKVQVADVGIPANVADQIPVELSTPASIAPLLPDRAPDSNKGTYGRVLVVGGSRQFVGAPGLSSIASLRIGAGLAEVATIPSVQQVIAAHALEPVYLPLAEEEGQIAPDVSALHDGMQRARAVVFGPGMGLSDRTIALARSMLDELSPQEAPPAVFDADGLNALSRIDEWWKSPSKLVLTPHPGEMSRLTGRSIGQIQADRVGTAQEFASEWGVVVILKGAGTVIADPSGRTAINPTGGSNLATGGTGDVLSGIVGGLLAQGCPPWSAAAAGAYVHGSAGDLLARRHGLAGTLAGDLLDCIPQVVMKIKEEAERGTDERT